MVRCFMIIDPLTQSPYFSFCTFEVLSRMQNAITVGMNLPFAVTEHFLYISY